MNANECFWQLLITHCPIHLAKRLLRSFCPIWMRRNMIWTLCNFFPFICGHKHYPLTTALKFQTFSIEAFSKHLDLSARQIFVQEENKGVMIIAELDVFHRLMYYTKPHSPPAKGTRAAVVYWGCVTCVKMQNSWHRYSNAYIILKTSVVNVFLCYCLMLWDQTICPTFCQYNPQWNVCKIYFIKSAVFMRDYSKWMVCCASSL